jgi:hypothetical protein
MSKEIRKNVFDVIKNSEVPIDAEKIANQLGIGWGTSLRYALELVILREIQGMKTSKSWVFWIPSKQLKRGEANWRGNIL